MCVCVVEDGCVRVCVVEVGCVWLRSGVCMCVCVVEVGSVFVLSRETCDPHVCSVLLTL